MITNNEYILNSSCEPAVQELLAKFMHGKGYAPTSQQAIVSQYESLKTETAIARLTRLLKPVAIRPDSCKTCAWRTNESRCANNVMLAAPRVRDDEFGRGGVAGLTVWQRHPALGIGCVQFLKKS